MEILNLEGNFISSLENGTLLVLRNSLKRLRIGNHNSFNNIFDEISQLKELQVQSYEDLFKEFSRQPLKNDEKYEEIHYYSLILKFDLR